MIKKPKKPYCSRCNGYVLSCYQVDPDRFSVKFHPYLDMKIALKVSFQIRDILLLRKLVKSVSFKIRPSSFKLIKNCQSYFNQCDIILEKKKKKKS